MKKNLFVVSSYFLLLTLSIDFRQDVIAQDAANVPAVSADASQTTAPPAVLPAPASTPASALPSPMSTPASAGVQVDAPSVTLPTPPLPQPPPLPTPTPEATPQPALLPAAEDRVFTPPTASSLNLPSAQSPGSSSPASLATPSMSAINSANGSGALGEAFDWAKRLHFQAAVRTGYDSNVNSVKTNVVGSVFANLNGGVNYRFGDPRLIANVNLTGGLTSYPNAPYNKLQGQIGLGVNLEYRARPRLVFAFDSSSSYQAQPNTGNVGTANNSSSPYIYTANSFSGSYQISDLWTSVTRLTMNLNSYLNNSNNNNQQGFNNPGFSQSFRYLYKPSTTLVGDYYTDLYGYSTSNNSSWGQTLNFGFDHIFNPQFFWNFRAGAEFRTFHNTIRGYGTYIGPSANNTVSWAFAKKSSISWNTAVGTQPSGQQNVSYSPTLRSSLNYSQGIFTRMTVNIGVAYLLANYQDNPVGAGGAPITYNQTNLQGNVDLNYQINRIFDFSLGYQYLTSYSPAVPSQEYNRGITYFQVQAGF